MRPIKASAVFCTLTTLVVSAGTIHVPSDAPTIQIAIEKAQPFDTIIVAPGSYFEAINFGGKVIVVQSENPNDDAVVESTVIDAGGLGNVVTFSGGEDQVNTILNGFTITGGTTGIRGNGTRASLRRCVVRNNTGPGIVGAHGVIERCTILGNGQAGLLDSDGEFRDCTIENNADGLFNCGGSISDSTILGNRDDGIVGGTISVSRCIISSNLGDGIASESGRNHRGTIRDSFLVGNRGRGVNGYGNSDHVFPVINTVVAGNLAGGFYRSRKDVLNCTITGNGRFGFEEHNGSISHVILWDNDLGALGSSSTPIFSGTSNPFFVQPGYWDLLNNTWIDGNYRLSPDSPYIDAGNPAYGNDANNPTTDIDGDPRIVGARVDIGAFEFQAECTGADFDSDGTSDTCDSDIDNDGVSNVPDKCDDTPSGITVDGDGRPIGDLNLDCRVNMLDFATLQNQFFGP